MALMGQAAGKAPEQQFALELSIAVTALKLTPKDLVLVLHTKEDCLLLLARLPVVVVVFGQRWGLVGGLLVGGGEGGWGWCCGGAEGTPFRL